MYEYSAKIIRVVDGDTIDVSLQLGFDVFKKERLRLYGIDTPETRTRDMVEKAEGLKATAFVKEKLEGTKLLIKTHKDSKGKFGRYLAEVYYESNGGYYQLNQELINEGLAKPYFGGKK